MHTFTLNFPISAPLENVWLALTDPKYVTRWDGNRWGQNDACVGGKLRARNEEGLLFEAEILLYDVGERLAVLAPVPVNPEEPDEGSHIVRQEFRLEPHKDKTVLQVSMAGFPDEAAMRMMQNTWGGYYLEKIGKVAEGVAAQDCEEFKRNLHAHDYPGHVRHTELATALR